METPSVTSPVDVTSHLLARIEIHDISSASEEVESPRWAANGPRTEDKVIFLQVMCGEGGEIFEEKGRKKGG